MNATITQSKHNLLEQHDSRLENLFSLIAYSLAVRLLIVDMVDKKISYRIIFHPQIQVLILAIKLSYC